MKLPRVRFTVRRMMVAVAIVAVLFSVLAWAVRAGAWWWASEAVGLSLYFFPRFARVAGAASLVALIAIAADRRVWRLRSLWMLCPLAVPILSLAFGAIFRNAGATASWPGFVVEWFPCLLLPLGLTLLACFRSVSAWFIIVCISTAAAWLSLGSAFLAVMSVTNCWL